MRNIIIVFLCISCGVKNVETTSSASADQTQTDTAQIGFDENNYESFLNLENYKVNGNTRAEETLVIDSSAVVVINPSAAQISEMAGKYGEDFETVADDASFYQAEAMMRIDSVGVKKVIISDEHAYVKLVGTGGNWLLGVRKEGAPEWNMIFFHVDREPEIVSAIDVTTGKIKEFFAK